MIMKGKVQIAIPDPFNKGAVEKKDTTKNDHFEKLLELKRKQQKERENLIKLQISEAQINQLSPKA